MCREKRDAALSTVGEAGRLRQDEVMIEGISVERLVVDEDCVLRIAEVRRWRALSYISLATHVVEGISVVESNNLERKSEKWCQQRQHIRGQSDVPWEAM